MASAVVGGVVTGWGNGAATGWGDGAASPSGGGGAACAGDVVGCGAAGRPRRISRSVGAEGVSATTASVYFNLV